MYGKATGPELDLDQQIVDRDWAEREVDKWFKAWGNIRQMHSGNLAPAGKAVELEHLADGQWVKSHIVEPGAVALCKNGVYQGYSIGIGDPRMVKDAAAPRGRIADGYIVELSLVDRPANPTCRMALAKMADGEWDIDGGDLEEPDDELLGGDMGDVDDDEIDECAGQDIPMEQKREFTAGERDTAAESGAAMPDGSFPIENEGDLENAIHAVGRADDPEKAKAHIIARAKDLGATDKLPADWPGSTQDAGKKALRLAHDALCPAVHAEALKGAYPDLEKNGLALALAPGLRAQVLELLAHECEEDGGTGSECWDIKQLADVNCDRCGFRRAYRHGCAYGGREGRRGVPRERRRLPRLRVRQEPRPGARRRARPGRDHGHRHRHRRR